MLESTNVDTQLHAFNLLFNLSIHFNLWDDTAANMLNVSAAGGGGESMYGADNSATGDRRKKSVVHDVQESLFEVLLEMCNQLISMTGKDCEDAQAKRELPLRNNGLALASTELRIRSDVPERLWNTALNAILFWSSADHRLLPQKLMQINPAVLVAFLTNIKVRERGEEETKCLCQTDIPLTHMFIYLLCVLTHLFCSVPATRCSDA